MSSYCTYVWRPVGIRHLMLPSARLWTSEAHLMKQRHTAVCEDLVKAVSLVDFSRCNFMDKFLLPFRFTTFCCVALLSALVSCAVLDTSSCQPVSAVRFWCPPAIVSPISVSLCLVLTYTLTTIYETWRRRLLRHLVLVGHQCSAVSWP